MEMMIFIRLICMNGISLSEDVHAQNTDKQGTECNSGVFGRTRKAYDVKLPKLAKN
jgi:hypothetical protein